MPYTGSRAGNFVTHKPNSIISWSRLDLIYRCAGPSNNGWLHPYRVTGGGKCEIGDASHNVLTIRNIVILVAFAGMCNAPLILMWSDILPFYKVCRARIECCVQVIDLNQDPMRHAIVRVAGVVV